MTAIGLRRPSLRAALVVVLVVIVLGGALGAGMVSRRTRSALGVLFDRLVAKVERFIVGPPPPDRADRPDRHRHRAAGDAAADPDPDAPAGQRPAADDSAPTPTPVPRVAVDVDIVATTDAVFAHEIHKDWCAPAGVTMVLAILGHGDATDAREREIAGRVHEWESYADSHNGEWGPSAMALALEAYGAPGLPDPGLRDAGRRAARRREGDLDDPLAGDPARLARRPHVGDDRLPGRRRPAVFHDAKVSGDLHPRPVVPVELVDLGPVRSARARSRTRPR